VVVLDVKLPDIDGFEVCRRMKANEGTSSIPVLMSSAVLVEDADKIKGLEHADAYLAEPVPPPVLTATVRALARMAQAEAERAELLASQRMERAASALVDVGRRLMTTWDETERGGIIVSALVEVFRARRAALLVLDASRTELRCAAAAGEDEVTALVGKTLLLGEALSGRVVTERRPRWTADILAEPDLKLPRWIDGMFRTGCRAWISVPLVVNDDVLGALPLGDTTGRVFRKDEIQLLEAFAAHAALALRNARLWGQLAKSGERLEALSRRLLEVQEAEQRRLARELHDEMGAALSAVKMEIQALGRRPELAPATRDLDRTVTAVDGLLQRVRQVSLDLRPSLLDDYGLEPALRWYVDRQSQRSRVDIRIVSDVGDLRLPTGVETACYRVAQAGITNALRHAAASRITVELHLAGDDLKLIVRDDGAGFDVAAARNRARRGESLGLLAMEERAGLVGGTLEIESVPGHGTELRASFPARPPRPASPR
jgi:signal transduction histidine kinase